MPEDTDQALVARVQAGDRDAFNLLVARYQWKIGGVIARHVFDPRDVEDLCQEVFIRAYRALPGFRGDSLFYTWLYRIAVNSAKNFLASSGRRMRSASVAVEDAAQAGAAALRDGATPEGNILQRELSQCLQAALRNLPAVFREALLMREMDGLSYDEIAGVMDCPVGTVRSRIFRAREALSAELQARGF
ncbi:MAG: RNA polymerase sigma factor RpoE [Gammaproteobacteria bacterium]|nr:RNA polymerase sigma factor RpoE [Gammaproteobacteria bacterium]MDD9816269.1 RNA polymerase sigma factor RpoE [Gammaproteobacteria bacterium]MDD9851397.1 RNA polymerase sigma factor RpoE [Gammaproteobacteria bacterium]